MSKFSSACLIPPPWRLSLTRSGRTVCCCVGSIGWADFSYNNGTAHTPHVKQWTESDGTVVMQVLYRLVSFLLKTNAGCSLAP